MDKPVEQKIIGDYRINVYYSFYPSNPCEDWDLAGNFYWMNERHMSGHARRDYGNSRKTTTDVLQELVAKYVDSKTLFEMFKKGVGDRKDGNSDYLLQYDRSAHAWYMMSFVFGKYYRHDCFEWTKDELVKHGIISEYVELIDDEDDLISLLDSHANDIAIDTWSSTGYCQGDYIEGICYMTKEQFDELCFSHKYEDWRDDAKECMEGEAEAIGRWAWNDVYGYTLEKKVPKDVTGTSVDDDHQDEEEYQEIDSCWDFFMDPEDVIKEVIADHKELSALVA